MLVIVLGLIEKLTSVGYKVYWVFFPGILFAMLIAYIFSFRTRKPFIKKELSCQLDSIYDLIELLDLVGIIIEGKVDDQYIFKTQSINELSDQVLIQLNPAQVVCRGPERVVKTIEQQLIKLSKSAEE